MSFVVLLAGCIMPLTPKSAHTLFPKITRLPAIEGQVVKVVYMHSLDPCRRGRGVYGWHRNSDLALIAPIVEKNLRARGANITFCGKHYKFVAHIHFQRSGGYSRGRDIYRHTAIVTIRLLDSANRLIASGHKEQTVIASERGSRHWANAFKLAAEAASRQIF